MKNTASLIFIVVASVHAVGQATINVPADESTIQAGIVSATPGDIVLVAPGTYFEQIDFLGKAISVVASGGPSTTTIDSSGTTQWNNSPRDSVVRFISGEGPSSILQGFTITGFVQFENGSPVSGAGETIINCHIVNNQGGTGGGGYSGNGTLISCVVSGNTTDLGWEGGGVYGAPTLMDCDISNNLAYQAKGGGIFATGPMIVTRCTIIGNSPAADGHSGGGVFGPATLIDCIIARNDAAQFGVFVDSATAIDGAVLVQGCTITENVFCGTEGLAVANVGQMVDCIVWNNQSAEYVDPVSVGSVAYSNIEGGYSGIGNIDADPLFVDPVIDDYSLETESPCIDAGDPNSLPDPDGTRSDMGAVPYTQFPASVVSRNGSGLNASILTRVTDPVLGTDWDADIDGSGHSSSFTQLYVYTGQSSGFFLTGGELLVDITSTFLTRESLFHFGGTVRFSTAIPDDLSLSGFTASGQAAVFGSPGYELSNALDLVLGF